MYENDAEFKLWCKMVTALAFAPIQRLNEAFVELLNSISEQFANELQIILDWFEDYYLGRERQGRRREPMFPPTIW